MMFFNRSIFFLLLIATYIVSGQESATLESNSGVSAGECTETSATESAKQDVIAASVSKEKNNPSPKKADEAIIDKEAEGIVQNGGEKEENRTSKPHEIEVPVQSGPFIDLLGERLYSLEMIDESRAQMHAHYTNEVLRGKKVVGLYFSADWCGPCKQFTPELVSFYNKMNARRGRKDEFEIIWISRCRDAQSYGQYFTHMNWLALPFEESAGQRGQALSDKYKVKGIPSLVLLDEIGNVITTEARNKIPVDKAGIGFPWRNPMATLYVNLVPQAFRLLLKNSFEKITGNALQALKGALGRK
mmetsp:Transcript_13966/g.13544  ORF Transcript_13966/g.13544 Transcript_13966/m.13544 type:complete len:302 (-) Transcript_13966:707-1612(-)